MTLTAIGTIAELQLHSEGYHKLTIDTRCPVENEIKILRFNVSKINLLQNRITGEQFDIGTRVRVDYHLKDPGFPCLDELTPTDVYVCPICDNTIETSRLYENCMSYW